MTKQELIDNMNEVMNQLSWVCAQNTDWTFCHESCPFDKYCDVILDADLNVPESWTEE